MDYRIEGNEVVFFVQENGIEISYAQDVGVYQGTNGEIDENKIVRAIMLAKLRGAFRLEIDNNSNMVVKVL